MSEPTERCPLTGEPPGPWSGGPVPCSLGAGHDGLCRPAGALLGAAELDSTPPVFHLRSREAEIAPGGPALCGLHPSQETGHAFRRPPYANCTECLTIAESAPDATTPSDGVLDRLCEAVTAWLARNGAGSLRDDLAAVLADSPSLPRVGERWHPPDFPSLGGVVERISTTVHIRAEEPDEVIPWPAHSLVRASDDPRDD